MSTLAILCVDEPGRAADLIPKDARSIALSELKDRGPARALAMLRRERVDRCLLVVGELRRSSAWLALHGLALAARARRRTAVTPAGDQLELTWSGFWGRELPLAWHRARLTRRVTAEARRRLAELRAAAAARPISPRRVLFARADLGQTLIGGGSHAHILGVAGALVRRGVPVTLTSPAEVAGLAERGVSLEVVSADDQWRLSVELPHLAYNATLLPRISSMLSVDGDLVYARHSLGSFAAALGAQRAGVPLVVEFNGPEVWIARNWGAARAHLELFEAIERAVLRSADLVVAVSTALVPVLRKIGVDENRVLVNPNGVDTLPFETAARPDRRAASRRELQLAEHDVLVGFIGTFGPWHGASVLARAAAILGARPGLKYLFVGDGVERPRTEAILLEAGLGGQVHFTGMLAASAVPELLAACDICVAPHVPNRDGTPFFGSPTKLFEYMAAGRAILASNLDQIGDVLQHGRSAWLVPPGDAAALAAGLSRLVMDAGLREQLGAAAADDAKAKHSWDAHVGRLLERLARPPGVG